MIPGNIPKRWKELSGSKNWENLLDPLDKDLRRYIVLYGQTAQATYDSFNKQKVSKYAGSCLYDRDTLFSQVGLGTANPFEYEIVKYVYATSDVGVSPAFIFKSLSNEAWCKNSNWMGYVAVSTDKGKKALGRRDIVVAWRGTVQLSEWFKDFDAPMVSSGTLFGDTAVGIHRGWRSIYTSSNDDCSYSKTSARDQVTSELERLMNLYKDEEISITVTGHSLGASLGTLNAVDIVANNINKPKDYTNSNNKPPCPVTAFLFGSPRVGGKRFRELVQKLEQLHILRVHNIRDIVPTLPPGGYVDVGKELRVDTLQSKYLKKPGSIVTWHNLEVHMHMVAGTQGVKGEFDLKDLERDKALVNKSTDALEEENLVAEKWWGVRNKGMVQREDSSWKLDDQPHFG